jgi:hypothetical protein
MQLKEDKRKCKGILNRVLWVMYEPRLKDRYVHDLRCVLDMG